MGSCRNQADEQRLQNLKDLAVKLKVEDDVEFYKNLMYRFAPFRFTLPLMPFTLLNISALSSMKLMPRFVQ